jgi:hypothetical protein
VSILSLIWRGRRPTQFFGVVERTGGSESIVTPFNETDECGVICAVIDDDGRAV